MSAGLFDGTGDRPRAPSATAARLALAVLASECRASALTRARCRVRAELAAPGADIGVLREALELLEAERARPRMDPWAQL